MNQRDRGQPGRRGGRDDERYTRSQRDTYNPEPQWLQQDRERQWNAQRDDELEYGIGGSQYGGDQYSRRRGPSIHREFGGRHEPSGWDDELAFGDENRYTPFRVGTGMGLGSYGRHREFGESYGASSGYASHTDWEGGAKRESYRGMGPANYKRSDERIRDDIYERLTESHHIDARGILVDVNQGNVTLNGTVSERRMRYMAEDLVERVSGVSNILNQLRVQRPEEAQRTTPQQDDKQHH